MKTLGVKFQVAGIDEAKAALKNLRQELNQSLSENKKVAAKTLKISKQTNSKPQSEIGSAKVQPQKTSSSDDFFDTYQRTLEAIRARQYQKAATIYGRPVVNRVANGFYEGIGNEAGTRAFSNFDNILRKLTGRKEYRETVELGSETINKIGFAVARSLGKVKQNKNFGFNQRDKNLNKESVSFSPEKETDSLSSIVSQVLMPIRTIQYSFFEGIGSNFGNRFANGLNEVLDQDLDISFERKGTVTGKAISYTATEGAQRFKKEADKAGDSYNDLIGTIQDGKFDEVAKKFDTFLKDLARSVTSFPTTYLRGFRKASIKSEALRKMENAKSAPDAQAPDLTGKNKVIYTVSGFAGEKGARSEYLAEQIKPYVNEQTQVIGVKNEFTDVLAPSDRNPVLWGVSALANLAKINLKGFNPDAVKLAAKVVNTLTENPEVEVELLGHSAGGFVVEEAQEILSLLGMGDKVKTKAVGTPRMAGNLENPNVDKIIGDGDFRIKPLEQALEYVGAATTTEKEVSGVKDHFMVDYLESDRFLEEVLGESLDPEKVKQMRKKQSPFDGKLIELEALYVTYISRMYQNLDDIGEELSVAPDRLVAKTRRGRLRDRGGKEVDRKLRDKDFRQIKLKEGTQTAVLVAGGFSGAKGRSGAKFAKQLNQLVEDDKTQYVGVRNPFTDVLDKEDIRNPDPQKSIPKILDMFGEVHKLGYNPDATEITAQTMDLLAKDPNLKVKIAGYSGGGYVAEDVMELLQSQGADMSRVEVMGLATPQLPGGIKNRDFQKVMGEGDPIMMANKLKELNNQVKSILGFDIFPELMTRIQNIQGINTHDLDEYVANSQEVQDFLYGHIPDSKELVQNHSTINSLHKDRAALNDEMDAIGDSKDLTSTQKLEKLNQLRERYINVLKSIHALAKHSRSIGGGQFFDDEREFAAVELEDAGVIVDPIKVPLENFAEDETEVLIAKAQNLADAYEQYLQNIAQSADENSGITAQLIARDFSSLDKQGQAAYLKKIRTNFNKKAQAYRNAINQGQLEVAASSGESLLILSKTIKKLYAEVADFENLDPKVKTDFGNYTRYASSVESEIITGSNANGRIEQGLPEIAADEFIAFEQDGSDVAEGFIFGILDRLAAATDAGEELIEATEQGIRNAGEIQSPSKLAKRLGRWFVKGFRLGLRGENLKQQGQEIVEEVAAGVNTEDSLSPDSLEQRGREVVEQIAEGMGANDLEARGREVVGEAAQGIQQELASAFEPNNIASLIDTGGAGLIKKLGSLLFDASQNEGFDGTINNIGLLAGKVVRLVLTFKLLKVALDAMGLGKLIAGFRNLPEEAINAAIAVEALDKRIVDMSGSARAGAKNLEFITKEAARLNRNLTDAKENFTQILRATRDTSLEGFQTENIYTAFAATAKSNALSQADEQQLFRSVRSMIGKGILSQEEVRQEIGERLGDFEQSLAEAYGVSRPQLNKMIENREIRATEALPKVAAVLRAKNDISGELDTGAAAAQRVDNSIQRFRESVGNALLPLQKFGNNFLAGFFAKLAALVDRLKPLVNGFFIALFANLLRLQILGQSVQKLLLGLIKLLWTMKGAMAIFAAEVALLAAAWAAWENVLKIFTSRYFPEINKDIAEITRGLKAYRLAIEEAKGATEELGNTRLQLAEGFKLPDNQLGDLLAQGLGSDYLNLDTVVRQPIDKVIGNKYAQQGVKTLVNLLPGGGVLSSFIPQKFTTRREQKEQQLKI
ncbi:MAG: tape measure protein, partial [Pleurocapsa sp. MO_192.B19]|nr:tape measure protein [Pleurocapsa sp. MO_192.B19]